MSTFDKDTLHLLSVFHYVFAGLIALLFCIPFIHFGLGISLVVGGVAEEAPALGVMGVTFALLAGFIILVGWVMAFLVFKAGKNLAKQENYQSCMIGAGILCIFIPLGTFLGVFTLVALQEDSIKEIFKREKTKQIPS